MVRRKDDKPTIENPFYHLAGDGFWHIEKPGGGSLYEPGNATGPPSMSVLRSASGRFDSALWGLMQNRVSRNHLREALVARSSYLPNTFSPLKVLSISSRRNGISGPTGMYS